jgi:hypothetical protein
MFGVAREIANAEKRKAPFSFVLTYRSKTGKKRTVNATLPFPTRDIREVIECRLPNSPATYIVLRTKGADWSLMPRSMGSKTEISPRKCHYYRSIPPAWDPLRPESFSGRGSKLMVSPGFTHAERRFDWLVREHQMPAQEALKKILGEAETLYINQLVDSAAMNEVYDALAKYRKLKG